MKSAPIEAGADAALQVLSANGLNSGKPVMLVGDESMRNTTLTTLAHKLGTKPINLNIALSEAVLVGNDKIDLVTFISAIEPGTVPLFLDRLHVLMLPQLQLDPLGLLSRVSRRRSLCVSWPGHFQDGRLKYAHHDHPEFFDEDASRVVVIDLATSESSEL